MNLFPMRSGIKGGPVGKLDRLSTDSQLDLQSTNDLAYRRSISVQICQGAKTHFNFLKLIQLASKS